MTDKKKLHRPKVREATGKLKECIDNQTKEGLDKARKQLEEESKTKFKVGDKVMYLNEEYVVTDNKDHYTLRSTKERTSVPVVHIDFGNEDYELRLVEESKKCMYTKDNYTDEDRKVLCEGCEEECRFSRKGLNTSERELIATREALAYVNNINRGESPWTDSDMEEAYEEGYKAGAKWQRQKDEHLIWQTSTANYEKGIEEGKQQMMKDAVDGVITFDYYKDDKAYGCVAHDSFCLEERGLRDCDKVKMIVVKEG